MHSRSKSLEPLARSWIRAKNIERPSPNTVAARKRDLALISTYLGDLLERPESRWATERHEPFTHALGRVRVSDLTAANIADAFAYYAAEGRSPASIRRVLSTWRGFCRWLVIDRGLLESNPIEAIQGPKATPWRPKPISEDELARVIGAAQNPSPTARHPWPEHERALCALLITAGLRVSELMALKVGDVGRRAGHEHARVSVAGKGRRERTVPLPPETLRILDAYLKSRRSRVGRYKSTDALLIGSSGEPLRRRAVDHLVRGWYRRAEVVAPKGALAHSLRHTYATLLVDYGASLPEVQALLGYANLATTQAYVGVTAHGLEAAAMANPARHLLGRRKR
jgi:site-specific recombinase XerD